MLIHVCVPMAYHSDKHKIGTDGWTHGRMGRWTDGQMDGWMDGWTKAAMSWGWRRAVREIRKNNPAKIKDRHQGELTRHYKAEGWAKGGTKHWGERVNSEHQKQASRNWNRSSNHPRAHPLTFLSRPCLSSFHHPQHPHRLRHC